MVADLASSSTSEETDSMSRDSDEISMEKSPDNELRSIDSFFFLGVFFLYANQIFLFVTF